MSHIGAYGISLPNQLASHSHVDASEIRMPGGRSFTDVGATIWLLLARSGLFMHDGRYKVLRKPSRGQYSSTWLVEDLQYEYISQHSNREREVDT